MAMAMRLLVVVNIVASLAAVASAIAGTATYYTTYVPSACYGYSDQGVMIGAASDSLWENGAACGRMYTVRCTGPTNQGVPHPCSGNSATIKIVDRCPAPGCQGTIDLSQEAFSMISVLAASKIYIEYTPA